MGDADLGPGGELREEADHRDGDRHGHRTLPDREEHPGDRERDEPGDEHDGRGRSDPDRLGDVGELRAGQALAEGVQANTSAP